jgi:hypothetical protein
VTAGLLKRRPPRLIGNLSSYLAGFAGDSYGCLRLLLGHAADVAGITIDNPALA